MTTLARSLLLQFASLELFTVSQVCDLTVQSGGLQNVDMMKVVLNHLGEGNILTNLEEFLVALGTKSQVKSSNYLMYGVLL